jgi:hypothetical protein
MVAVAAVGTVPTVAGGQPMSGLRPLEPQPDPAALRPGLAVTYHYNMFRHVDQLVQWAKSNEGEAGRPLPVLDYNVGPGRVLNTEKEDGVGAVIEGLIRFPEAGTYEIVVHSNDGVKLRIGDVLVYADPDVHPDRLSEPIPVRIDQAGWYPLSVLYFERKGTSTLELYWLLPGEPDRVRYVPAEAYAHLPM